MIAQLSGLYEWPKDTPFLKALQKDIYFKLLIPYYLLQKKVLNPLNTDLDMLLEEFLLLRMEMFQYLNLEQ